MTFLIAAPEVGSVTASWTPLLVMLGVFGFVIVALGLAGRPDHPSRIGRFVLKAPSGVERLTGVPAWAGAAVGIALYGLLLAGYGFYDDVAWHVALGRDKELFTPPHTAIVVGLVLIFGAAVVAVVIASLTLREGGLAWRGIRIPLSVVPLGLLGGGALMGFPLDEVWHHFYGIDVTMWSPTHMLMILAASFTGIAAWLVLADAKVRPSDSRWARGLHVVAGWLTLQGLAASLGEFRFGVPQFQQLFHPVLLCIAAGFGFVAIRIILGRGWGMGIAVFSFLFDSSDLISGSVAALVDARLPGIFIGSAVSVEIAAWLMGTDRRLRFALASGIAVATLGLATEWAWNQNAHQPWLAALLPDALILGIAGAAGAAVLAAAFGTAVAHEERSISRGALLLAGVALLIAIFVPMPRRVGQVHAKVSLERLDQDSAVVRVRLEPPDAAADARWFQVTSWQGGGLVLAPMRRSGPGEYTTDRPVPISGDWKTLLRLHRNNELMTVPIWLPADPEIGEHAVRAVDRTARFEAERKYLLRESPTSGGPVWVGVNVLLAMAGALWMASFAFVAARIAPSKGRAGLDIARSV